MTFLRTISGLCILGLLVACVAHRPEQAVSSSPTLSPTSAAATTVKPSREGAHKQSPSATASPTASSSPSASSSQSAPPLESPLSTPTAAPATGANAPPEFHSIVFNKTVVQGGDHVIGTVITSLNTASVELRIGTYSFVAVKTGPGRFHISYVVPNLPFFLRHGYTMNIIARNTRGDEALRHIQLTIY